MAWVYVTVFPLAFLESGYTSWLAKETMLGQCDLGKIMFFGNSRVEAGIVSVSLPETTTNIGVAAGTPIEVHSGVARAMKCAQKPRFVVLSLTPEAYGPLGPYFWIDAVRYGFLTPSELWGLEWTAQRLADTDTLWGAKTPDGLSGPARDWLYELHFPSVYFSSLVQGQIFRRYADNVGRMAKILRARGYVSYTPHPPDDALGPEAKLDQFVSTNVQNAYFEKTLKELNDNGVATGLLLMPVKIVTHQAMASKVEAAYIDYLRSLTSRFPNVRLINSQLPQWPSAMFADAVHLNPTGAEAFTARLAACVEEGSVRSDCDLAWSVSEAGRAVSPS